MAIFKGTPMHIQHIALNVRDLDASISCYRAVSGLEVNRRMVAGLGEIAFLTNGDRETQVELIAMPEGRKYEGQGWFLCLSADQLDQRHATVTEMGLKPFCQTYSNRSNRS